MSRGGAFGDDSFTSVSESETRTASVGLGPDGLASPEVSAQPTRTDSVTQRGSGLTTTVNNSEAELNFDDSAWASVDKSDDESESRSTAPPSTPVTVSPEAIEELMRELDPEHQAGMGQSGADSVVDLSAGLGASPMSEGSAELDRLVREARIEAEEEAEHFARLVSFQRKSGPKQKQRAMRGWMQVVRSRWTASSDARQKHEPAFRFQRLVRLTLFRRRVRSIYLRHSKYVRDRQGDGAVELGGEATAAGCAKHCSNELDGGFMMYPEEHYKKCFWKILGLPVPRTVITLEKTVSPVSVTSSRHFRRLYEARSTASRQHYVRTIEHYAVVIQRAFRRKRPDQIGLAAAEVDRRHDIDLEVRARRYEARVGALTLKAKAWVRDLFSAWAAHLRSVQAEHTQFCLSASNGWVAARTSRDISTWGSERAEHEQERSEGNLASTYVCVLRSRGQSLYLRRMALTAELCDSTEVRGLLDDCPLRSGDRLYRESRSGIVIRANTQHVVNAAISHAPAKKARQMLAARGDNLLVNIKGAEPRTAHSLVGRAPDGVSAAPRWPMQGVLDSWIRTYGEISNDVYDWDEGSDEEKAPTKYRKAQSMLAGQILPEYDTIETFDSCGADSINKLFATHAARTECEKVRGTSGEALDVGVAVYICSKHGKIRREVEVDDDNNIVGEGFIPGVRCASGEHPVDTVRYLLARRYGTGFHPARLVLNGVVDDDDKGMRRYDYIVSEAHVWRLPKGVPRAVDVRRLVPSDSSLYRVKFWDYGGNYDAMVDREDIDYKAALSDRDIVTRTNVDATLIAIAGAPSGGKSTCAKSMVAELNKRGVPAYLLPEVATSEIKRLGDRGVPIESFSSPSARMALQVRFFEKQVLLEDQIMAKAAAEQPGEKVVVVCDSGLPSGKAYVEPDMWTRLEKMVGVTTARMLDRYHGAVVLETVASYDKSLYEFGAGSNNEARYHNPDQAVREVQPALVDVWSQHPRYRYVKAREDFSEKLDDSFASLVEVLPAKIAKRLRASSDGRPVKLSREVDELARFLAQPPLEAVKGSQSVTESSAVEPEVVPGSQREAVSVATSIDSLPEVVYVCDACGGSDTCDEGVCRYTSRLAQSLSISLRDPDASVEASNREPGFTDEVLDRFRSVARSMGVEFDDILPFLRMLRTQAELDDAWRRRRSVVRDLAALAKEYNDSASVVTGGLTEQEQAGGLTEQVAVPDGGDQLGENGTVNSPPPSSTSANSVSITASEQLSALLKLDAAIAARVVCVVRHGKVAVGKLYGSKKLTSLGGTANGHEIPKEVGVRTLGEQTGLIVHAKELQMIGEPRDEVVEGRSLKCFTFVVVRGSEDDFLVDRSRIVDGRAVVGPMWLQREWLSRASDNAWGDGVDAARVAKAVEVSDTLPVIAVPDLIDDDMNCERSSSTYMLGITDRERRVRHELHVAAGVTSRDLEEMMVADKMIPAKYMGRGFDLWLGEQKVEPDLVFDEAYLKSEPKGLRIVYGPIKGAPSQRKLEDYPRFIKACTRADELRNKLVLSRELDTTLELPENDDTTLEMSAVESMARSGEHNCARRNLGKLARRVMLFRRGYPALREYLEGVASKLGDANQGNRHSLRRFALDPNGSDSVQGMVQDKWHRTMRDGDMRESFHLSSDGFFDVDDVDEYEDKVSLILEHPGESRQMRSQLARTSETSFSKYGRDGWKEHLERSCSESMQDDSLESSVSLDESSGESLRGIGARIREHRRDAKRKLEISAFADQWFSLHSEDIREIMDSYQRDVDESRDPYEMNEELRGKHEERYQRELRRFGHRDVERRFAADAAKVLPSHCIHCCAGLGKRDLGMICNDCKFGFHAREPCVGPMSAMQREPEDDEPRSCGCLGAGLYQIDDPCSSMSGQKVCPSDYEWVAMVRDEVAYEASPSRERVEVVAAAEMKAEAKLNGSLDGFEDTAGEAEYKADPEGGIGYDGQPSKYKLLVLAGCVRVQQTKQQGLVVRKTDEGADSCVQLELELNYHKGQFANNALGQLSAQREKPRVEYAVRHSGQFDTEGQDYTLQHVGFAMHSEGHEYEGKHQGSVWMITFKPIVCSSGSVISADEGYDRVVWPNSVYASSELKPPPRFEPFEKFMPLNGRYGGDGERLRDPSPVAEEYRRRGGGATQLVYWMQDHLSSLAPEYNQADMSGSEGDRASDHGSELNDAEPAAQPEVQATPMHKRSGADGETPVLPGLNSAFKDVNASTIKLTTAANMGDSMMGESGQREDALDPLAAFLTSEANVGLESSIVSVVEPARASGLFKDDLPSDDPYSGLNWRKSAQASKVLYVAPRDHGDKHADRCKPMYAQGLEVMRSEPNDGEDYHQVLVAQTFTDRAPTIYYCVNSRYVHPWNGSDEHYSFLNKEFHPQKDPSKYWEQVVGKIGREDVRAFGKYHVDLASLRQVAQNHLPALVYANRVDSSFLDKSGVIDGAEYGREWLQTVFMDCAEEVTGKVEKQYKSVTTASVKEDIAKIKKCPNNGCFQRWASSEMIKGIQHIPLHLYGDLVCTELRKRVNDKWNEEFDKKMVERNKHDQGSEVADWLANDLVAAFEKSGIKLRFANPRFVLPEWIYHMLSKHTEPMSKWNHAIRQYRTHGAPAIVWKVGKDGKSERNFNLDKYVEEWEHHFLQMERDALTVHKQRQYYLKMFGLPEPVLSRLMDKLHDEGLGDWENDPFTANKEYIETQVHDCDVNMTMVASKSASWRRGQSNGQGGGNAKGGKSEEKQRAPKGVCFNCGKKGHLSRDCHQKKDSASVNAVDGDPRKCFKCGEPGHLASDCTGKVKCFNCGKTGHISTECNSPPRGGGGGKKGGGGGAKGKGWQVRERTYGFFKGITPKDIDDNGFAPTSVFTKAKGGASKQFPCMTETCNDLFCAYPPCIQAVGYPSNDHNKAGCPFFHANKGDVRSTSGTNCDDTPAAAKWSFEKHGKFLTQYAFGKGSQFNCRKNIGLLREQQSARIKAGTAPPKARAVSGPKGK